MENPNEQVENQKKPSKGLKITVLVVLIALLAVGILLPIKLVPNAFSSIASSISSLFVANKNVTISSNKTNVNSGDDITLSWNGDHKTNGTYSLSYDCSTGLRLQTSTNQPHEIIPCGTTYYFSPNQNSIDVTAISESVRYADAKITLGFLENGASTLDTLAHTIVTVTNSTISDNLAATNNSTTTTSNPTTPAPSTTVSVTPTTSTVMTTESHKNHPVSNPHGLADLEVRPTATGYITNNGVFIPSNSVTSSQQAAVKFSIVNVGDRNSGTWTFAMDIPSQTDPRFVSATQQNLGPGDRIEYVLGFKNINNTQQNTITITADPSNFLSEFSKANNSVQMHILNNQAAGSLSGNADLSVHILDTGIIDRSNGTYTVKNSAGSSDKIGIRFQVTNNGTDATGAWKFQATLPASDSRIAHYISDSEPSLNPGQSMTFSLGFETLKDTGINTATITVDSANQVNESNESNNTASVNIVRN